LRDGRIEGVFGSKWLHLVVACARIPHLQPLLHRNGEGARAYREILDL